jgi:hypothetical protein
MSSIRIGEPRFYGSRQRLVWGGLYALIGLPTGVSVAMTLVLFWYAATGVLIGPLVWPAGILVALMSILLVFYFPISAGNLYVERLAGKYPMRDVVDGPPDLVQVILTPTTLSEQDRLLDDADDHGWLELLPNELRFRGDHSEIDLSFDDVVALGMSSVGWRGMWLMGHRLTLELRGLVDGFQRVELASRKGLDLRTSHRASRELVRRFRETAARAGWRVT